MSFLDLMSFFGSIIMVLGLLVFGVAAGWFSLFAFRQPERRWELQIAVFLGLFLLTALLASFSTPAGLGSFALGLGAGLLFWGLRQETSPEETPDKEE